VHVLSGMTWRQAAISSTFYRVSLSLEGSNYFLCIQSKSAGFSFVNTGKRVHLKHARRHFERNLVKDVHHRSVSIQKLVKKLETRGSRSNACWLLSLGPTEGQSVQECIPNNRTTQRRYSPRDSSRQLWHFGKSIPEFEEMHSSVLGCERRPVSASIMSRSCFASFPVYGYKCSCHYLSNIIFIDNSFGPLARDSPCIFSLQVTNFSISQVPAINYSGIPLIKYRVSYVL